MLLVAMVPFLTMAQKRSKKGKNVKTEKIVESSSSYEFMVIKGYESVLKKEGRDNSNIKSSDYDKIELIKSSKILIDFDFGGVPKNLGISKLSSNVRSYRTMAAAVNAAANEGWDFLSSNVILSGEIKIHYYYMKRNK